MHITYTYTGGPSTRHLINREVLCALGSKGILINVARGSVVDEQALVECLQVCDIDRCDVCGGVCDVCVIMCVVKCDDVTMCDDLMTCDDVYGEV